MRPEQAETLRTGYCLGSPFDSELRENVLDVRLYRLRRNAEVSCRLEQRRSLPLRQQKR